MGREARRSCLAIIGASRSDRQNSVLAVLWGCAPGWGGRGNGEAEWVDWREGVLATQGRCLFCLHRLDTSTHAVSGSSWSIFEGRQWGENKGATWRCGCFLTCLHSLPPLFPKAKGQPATATKPSCCCCSCCCCRPQTVDTRHPSDREALAGGPRWCLMVPAGLSVFESSWKDRGEWRHP